MKSCVDDVMTNWCMTIVVWQSQLCSEIFIKVPETDTFRFRVLCPGIFLKTHESFPPAKSRLFGGDFVNIYEYDNTCFDEMFFCSAVYKRIIFCI